jgi:hypothetical protein
VKAARGRFCDGLSVMSRKRESVRDHASAFTRNRSAACCCSSYAGIPIFWDYGDVRDDIDVGTPNDAGIISGPPHGLGKTLEWRLVDGRPFAIIYRVDSQSTGITWARLIVETIGGPGKPGCPIAKFDALKPNANVAARRAADVVLTGKAHCIDFDE